MPGSITLPQIVLDLEEEDRKRYEQLKAPTSMVLRYGYMKLVAELPYDGTAKPGCGSKLVIRTARGIELAEMLTSTCPNAGCGHAVTRKQMLQYIENSGGKDYPFTTQGKVLRLATPEDILEQARLDSRKTQIIQGSRALVRELDLPMRVVDVELLLGGERIIFHYTSEQWVDFRELVRRLASDYQTRIEMHQVNARDEARLVADYEKCGQHCCCKQFLKVLKPVSMKNAKIQKATLDPTKISGRCGRLMCCLRYEEETYDSLRKRLPKKQTRVMTDDGAGTVLDSQILTQLLLVLLDKSEVPAAYPLESVQLLTKEEDAELKAQAAAAAAARPEPRRYVRPGGPGGSGGPGGPGAPGGQQSPRGPRPSAATPPPRPAPPVAPVRPAMDDANDQDAGEDEGEPMAEGAGTGSEESGGAPNQGGGGQQPPVLGPDGQPLRRRRRRRRRRGRGGQGGQGGQGSQGQGGDGGGAPPSGGPQ